MSYSNGGVILNTNSQKDNATKAVKEFNRISPTLSSFASAVAGKKLRVKAGIHTQTDGSVIYVRPPKELAVKPKHHRNLCDQRGDDGLLVCPGCARIETLYYQLQHEMAHCIHGSLDKFTNGPIKSILARAIKTAKEYGTEEYSVMIYGMTFHYKNQRMNMPELANLIFNNVIGTMNNFVEDYRIESRAAAARAGFKEMSYWQCYNIMENGIPDINTDQVHRWQDQPNDSQLMAAWLFDIQGLDISNSFSDEVVSAIEAFKDTNALIKIPLNDVKDSFVFTIAFIGFMNKLGYYKFDKNGEHDESSKDESGDKLNDDNGSEQFSGGEQQQSGGQQSGGQQSGGRTGSGGKSTTGDTMDSEDEDSSNSSNTSEDECRSTESSSGDSCDDGNSGDSDDNLVNRDVQSENDSNSSGNSDSGDDKSGSAGNGTKIESQDEPSNNKDVTATRGSSGKIEINELGNHCGAYRDVDNYEVPDDIEDDILEIIINQAENFDDFSDNIEKLIHQVSSKSDTWEGVSRHESEKPSVVNISGPALHARRIFSDSKLDKNYHGLKKGKLDSKVLGSRAWNEDERLFKRKIRAQGISSEVCIGMDISYSTNSESDGFTLCDKIKMIGYLTAELLTKVGVDFSIHAHSTTNSWHDGMSQVISTIKDVNEPWNDKAKNLCMRLVPYNGSLDGHNFEFYRKVLQRSRARRKLLIYFTDGQIPATNRDEEIEILHREFKILKKENIAMLGVGMSTDSPKEIGMDTVLVTDHTDLSTVLKEIEKRIIPIG